MKTTKSVKWELENGLTAECKITVTRDVDDDIAYADGANIDLGKKTYESIDVATYIDGKYINTDNNLELSDDKRLINTDAVAILANKIGIKIDTYTAIKKAIEEAIAEATTPEYTALKTIEDAKKDAEKRAYNIATERHNNLLKQGLCPKCGTFCYGDCES